MTLLFGIVICIGIVVYRIRHRIKVKPQTTTEANRQSIDQTRTTKNPIHMFHERDLEESDDEVSDYEYMYI